MSLNPLNKLAIRRKFRYLLSKRIHPQFIVKGFSQKSLKRKFVNYPGNGRDLKVFLLNNDSFNSKQLFFFNKWYYYKQLVRRNISQLTQWRRPRLIVRKRSSLKILIYRKKYLLRSRYNYLRKGRRFRVWRRNAWNLSVSSIVAEDYFDFLTSKLNTRKYLFFSQAELKQAKYNKYLFYLFSRKYFYFSGFFKFRRIRSFWFRPLFGQKFPFLHQLQRWRNLGYSFYQKHKFQSHSHWAQMQFRYAMSNKVVTSSSTPFSSFYKSNLVGKISALSNFELKKRFLVRKKASSRVLNVFLSLKYTQFKNYYKCLVLFKKIFMRAYLPKHKKLNRLKYDKCNNISVSYNFPRKKLICFLHRYELLLPVVLKRFFLLRKLTFARKIIYLHGVVINNKLVTHVNTKIQVGDLIECSLKSHLYFEPFMLSSMLFREHSRFIWWYNYAFIVNLTYYMGIYYRLPNPAFIPFYQYLLKKKKKRFLNFFVHYLQ